MSQFTVKNRKKRKYVRKTEPTRSYPSTLALGVLPTAIMIIALIATILINHPPKDTFGSIGYSISTPTLSLSSITQFVQSLLQNTIHFLATFVPSEVPLVHAPAAPEIHLSAPPKIQFDPNSLLKSISVLNPLPLIVSAVAGLFTTSTTIAHWISAFLVDSVHVCMYLAQGIYTIAVESFNYLSVIAVDIARFIGSTLSILYHFLVFLVNAFVNILVSIYQTFVHALDALYTMITTPFIEAGKSTYIMLKPLLDFLGQNFQTDTKFFTDSINDMLNYANQPVGK